MNAYVVVNGCVFFMVVVVVMMMMVMVMVMVMLFVLVYKPLAYFVR